MSADISLVYLEDRESQELVEASLYHDSFLPVVIQRQVVLAVCRCHLRPLSARRPSRSGCMSKGRRGIVTLPESPWARSVET
jgi:hypothetical protein